MNDNNMSLIYIMTFSIFWYFRKCYDIFQPCREGVSIKIGTAGVSAAMIRAHCKATETQKDMGYRRKEVVTKTVYDKSRICKLNTRQNACCYATLSYADFKCNL